MSLPNPEPVPARHAGNRWLVRLGIILAVPAIGVIAVLAQAQRSTPEADADLSRDSVAQVAEGQPAQPSPTPEVTTSRRASPSQRTDRVAVSRSVRPNPKSLTLVVAGTATLMETYSDTVGDFLGYAGVELSDDDRVSPGVDQTIAGGQTIVVERVDVHIEVESEHLAFGTVERETSDRLRGETVVTRAGQDGLRERTVERVHVDGVEESRRVVDVTETDPVDEVVEVGTADPPPPAPAPSSSDGAVWDRLAECESNGNWAANTGNGYFGGLQFHPGTWTGHGGEKYAPSAHQATREQQIDIARSVQRSQGWRAWPWCSSHLGLR